MHARTVVLLDRLSRLAIPTAVLTVASVAPDVALADQEPVRITYQAEGACPSERSFREDVESRTELVRHPAGRETRQFIVMLKDDGPRSLGRLVIGDQHGSVVMREVTGESCAEVASALALITALAVDPQASTEQRTELVAEPSVAPTPSPAEPGTQTAVGVELPPPPPWALTRPGPAVKWHWTVGLDGIALLGFGLPAALGGSAFAELGPSGKWYVWPGFRLGFAYAITVPWTNDAGVGARWQWLLGHAEACPLRFRPGELDLHMGLCAVVDAGVIRSEGQYLANPRRETRLLVVPGILARLSWGLRAGVLFEIAGGPSWPVRHWRYTYQTYAGESSLSEISGPGETISLGVGYRFP